MTRQEWINVINKRQDQYVNELITLIEKQNIRKTIFFNSPTGTGKTVMVSKLLNKLSSEKYFFLITTLSRGGLNKQVLASLTKTVNSKHFFVFGTSSFTSSTILKESDILKIIPEKAQLIWIRDEGHIKTNKWAAILEKKASKIINCSATNDQVDIQCNFADTPMLRTPLQMYGSPEDSINKLLQVKKTHQQVQNYNPCLLVRDVSGEVTEDFEQLCKLYGLKMINISNDDTDVQDLCKNDNEYDVIINKMKITEGIDIPRASVIYIGNRPNNKATLIQIIGRVRRNALLWNNEIDIFTEENRDILRETTKTYIYYGKQNSSLQIKDDELVMELSDFLSVQQLLPDVVDVKENKLENGYTISELTQLESPYSGKLKLDHSGQFVTISNLPELYLKKTAIIKECGQKFKAIVKDKSLVEVSFDKSKYFRIGENGKWQIATTVSDNIAYGKLRDFITSTYKTEISEFDASFHIQEKIDKTIDGSRKEKIIYNYLLKSFVKYLFYGEVFLLPYLAVADSRLKDFNKEHSKNDTLFYALQLQYRSQMQEFYGDIISRLIPCYSEGEIIQFSSEQKNTLIKEAKHAFQSITNCISFQQSRGECSYISHHLGSRNILHGVADLILSDSIIILATGKELPREQLLKGLAYHFLSTKRYDLKINRIVFYDFCSHRSIVVPISQKNRSSLKNIQAEQCETKRFLDREANGFELGRILSFFRLNGEDFTRKNIDKFIFDLRERKKITYVDEKGEKKTIGQKRIIKSLIEVGKNEFAIQYICQMSPSHDTLQALIKLNAPSTEILSHIEKIKPNENDLSCAIQSQNEESVFAILSKINAEPKNLIEAMNGESQKIIHCVLEHLHCTKYNANDIIRTQNILAIGKLFNKIKPTRYNFEIAEKTKNPTVIAFFEKFKKKM